MRKRRLHTHYETLRVDRRASAQLVRMAYRRLAQKFHPDRYQGKGDSAAFMAQLNQAYEVLSDEAARERYDHWLSEEEARRARPRVKVAAAAGSEMQRAENRSWLLVWLIASVTLVVLGWVALRTLLPKQPQMVIPAAAGPLPVVDTTPLAPIPKIEPWKEPPPSARPTLAETEPVARLVREGVLQTPKQPTRP